MSIIGIAAVAQNLAIGKGGTLPWHYSSDLKFFKATTVDNTVVMGFNTWQSIGKVLPRRLNIVLSRSRNLEAQVGLLVMRTEAEVVALSKYLRGDLYVIGGAAVYESFTGVIDKWLVTEIPLAVENADAFMPSDFLDNFRLAGEELTVENLRIKSYERKS
jgi:dihydrofolate reductase